MERLGKELVVFCPVEIRSIGTGLKASFHRRTGSWQKGIACWIGQDKAKRLAVFPFGSRQASLLFPAFVVGLLFRWLFEKFAFDSGYLA